MTRSPGRRVLVCGSRDFGDIRLLATTLDRLHAEAPFAVVIHGGARGADTIAGQWANRRGVPVWPFPADWETHGKAAGPIRNRRMMHEGDPELVVAFVSKPLAESRGTADMCKVAEDAGISPIVITPR
jgi:hypothetical protein